MIGIYRNFTIDLELWRKWLIKMNLDLNNLSLEISADLLKLDLMIQARMHLLFRHLKRKRSKKMKKTKRNHQLPFKE